jgi:cobalt-precorrin 5A hydrolase/precorrin-3B C17-methyltransferase
VESQGAAIIVLGPGGGALGRRVRCLLPGSELYGPAAHRGDWDQAYERVMPLLAGLFAAGRPIVGLCAAGILVRAVAPLLDDKRAEPPVVALAEDGSAAVPLLGGHHGGNALARAIAAGLADLGCVAAITTAGDLRLGFSLDEPPSGWRIANPDRIKPVVAALLAGRPVALIEEAAAADWLRAGSVSWTVPVSPHPYPPPRAREGITPEAAAPPPRAAEGRAGASDHGKAETILVTDRTVSLRAEALVFHPPVLALGIGCERFCPAEEIAALACDSLAEAGLAPGAVAAVVSVALKADEPGIHALAQALGVPPRFFSAERLLAETERLTVRSEAAFRATGCWGVAEGAALAAAGAEGALVAARRQSRRATCAIARAAAPLDAATLGRPRGRLAIIGIGPGDLAWRTQEANVLLAAANDVIGYGLYLDLLGRAVAGKRRHESTIGRESERARLALDLAASGGTVALVSSGDAGIYGLAALVFELLDRGGRRDWSAVEITVTPGVSAMQAAAARLGAPLGNDFCAISLSDLLTPWPRIRARIEAAAAGDFVVALYNPRSARRPGYLAEAAALLLEHRRPDTPVAIARNLGRDGETCRLLRLDEVAGVDVDMLSLVLVGNSQTRRLDGPLPRLYTPRGYFAGGDP